MMSAEIDMDFYIVVKKNTQCVIYPLNKCLSIQLLAIRTVLYI